MEPCGQGSLGCLLKHHLVVLPGKGVAMKTGRGVASQGSGKWLSASSASDYPVRNMGCYWIAEMGKK